MDSPTPTADAAPRSVRRAIDRNSFCVLATWSATTGAHAVGVMYSEAEGDLYVATMRDSAKARNIAANPRIGVCIPARRFPFSPPFVVQFRAAAQVLASNDATIERLLRAGKLKRITRHGELDEPRTCFLRLVPDPKVSTYGVGVSLWTLARDPLHASRTFELERTSA